MSVARWRHAAALLFVAVVASSGGTQPPAANPQASASARALLALLRALPSRPTGRLIAGQHCGGVRRLNERYEATVEGVAQATGQRIALVGSDFIGGFDDAARARLASHWHAGGLVTLCYHAPNPWTGGPSDDRTIGDFVELTTPGTAAYAAWQRTLDQTAEWLAGLRDDGVIVLWRPFHEMNLPGSHWWASRDQAAFIALWQQMFTRFSQEERLDNLLWVYSPNAEFAAPTKATRPVECYYPGSEYVDITGLDIYTCGPLNLREAGYAELLALGKPMALCEFGPRGPVGEREPPDHTYAYGDLLRQLRDDYPEVVYFMAWMDSFALARQNGAADLLRDNRVLTVERLARQP
jgi:mannan endo-1,4-beta-mannosidase